VTEVTESHPPATRSRRLLAGLFLAALSGITGIVSYNHGLAVVRGVGNSGLVAYLVPLVPDLMIVTSSLTLIEASALKVARPLMAMAALVAGIGWTVAMNVAAGIPAGTGSALINAGVPLAFVLTFESLLWLFRRGRGGPFPEDMGTAPVTSSQDQPPEPLGTMEALRALLESASQRQLVEALGVSKYRVEAWSAMVRQAPEPPAGGAQDGRGRGAAPEAGGPPVSHDRGQGGAACKHPAAALATPERGRGAGFPPGPNLVGAPPAQDPPAGVVGPSQAAPAGANGQVPA
jgi:hypothetical protein